jgi:hypothetical protein
MKTKDTTIRGIPEESYQVIVDEADRERRSINSQLVIALIYYATQLQKEQDEQQKKE